MKRKQSEPQQDHLDVVSSQEPRLYLTEYRRCSDMTATQYVTLSIASQDTDQGHFLSHWSHSCLCEPSLCFRPLHITETHASTL